jgi:hypothetical protein
MPTKKVRAVNHAEDGSFIELPAYSARRIFPFSVLDYNTSTSTSIHCTKLKTRHNTMA